MLLRNYCLLATCCTGLAVCTACTPSTSSSQKRSDLVGKRWIVALRGQISKNTPPSATTQAWFHTTRGLVCQDCGRITFLYWVVKEQCFLPFLNSFGWRVHWLTKHHFNVSLKPGGLLRSDRSTVTLVLQNNQEARTQQLQLYFFKQVNTEVLQTDQCCFLLHKHGIKYKKDKSNVSDSLLRHPTGHCTLN